uniref:SLIT and NTRK like family member 1 n=1 Tax=Neogobius melanostomus TaxID=47308 RepID=A0A8C6SDH5_9GOBI
MRGWCSGNELPTLKKMLLWIVLLNAALCVASGNVTRDVCKEQICSCNEIEGDVHIDCEKRSLTTLQQLTGPSSHFYHLLLHGNSLSRLFPNEFANFYNAVSLHLENNGLHDIVPGAFLGLQLVKRLHINNNKIRTFRKSTFLGLDDLEYLQADFNLLRELDPAVFRDINKLEVLILNDNLISALPINGVLEQIPGIAEVLLEDNPWDCNCELASLKEWLENIPRNALIGRVICEAPTRLQGSDLNETTEAELCPSQSGGADTSLVAPPTQDQTSNPAAAKPLVIYVYAKPLPPSHKETNPTFFPLFPPRPPSPHPQLLSPLSPLCYVAAVGTTHTGFTL